MDNTNNTLSVDFGKPDELLITEIDDSLEFFLHAVNISKSKIDLEKVNIEHAILDFESIVNDFIKEHPKYKHDQTIIKYMAIILRFKSQISID